MASDLLPDSGPRARADGDPSTDWRHLAIEAVTSLEATQAQLRSVRRWCLVSVLAASISFAAQLGHALRLW